MEGGGQGGPLTHEGKWIFQKNRSFRFVVYHFLMVRALACLGLVLGLGWAHPNPNPNAHPNPNPNPNQVDEKLMCYSCTHTAAAWKLATLLNAPTCDAAG